MKWPQKDKRKLWHGPTVSPIYTTYVIMKENHFKEKTASNKISSDLQCLAYYGGTRGNSREEMSEENCVASCFPGEKGLPWKCAFKFFFFLPALKHSTSGFDRKYPTNSVKKHASYLIYWRLGMSNCQILCKRTNINYILTFYISDSFSQPIFKSSIHRWCIQAK